MIQWIATVQEGNYLSGIAAMNDLIAMFPRDKHLYYLAANWLMGEQGYEQAHHLLHKALEIDPDYAAALNDLAYVHAHNREFEEAIAAMDRYAALLPREPSPQDTYAEISRMARIARNQLEELAGTNRNRVIQECWHGAAGEVLAAQGKFKDAIPELEEDKDNPATLALLIKEYGEAGEVDKGKGAEGRLRTTNMPTTERALAASNAWGKATGK